ncbi:MAG TPA: hypothetical protein VFV74_01650 [Burkholderiales bacterium]|nr:hypothetical protein [Burkholderiales bacterium]
MKTVIALVAVLLVALSTVVRADDGGTAVKSEGGNVSNGAGEPVNSGKY